MTPLGPATHEDSTAYRAGNCRDCHTKKQSPGRTRCPDCHHNYIQRMEKGEI